MKLNPSKIFQNTLTRARKLKYLNISFHRARIEPTNCHIYSRTPVPCATTDPQNIAEAQYIALHC